MMNTPRTQAPLGPMERDKWSSPGRDENHPHSSSPGSELGKELQAKMAMHAVAAKAIGIPSKKPLQINTKAASLIKNVPMSQSMSQSMSQQGRMIPRPALPPQMQQVPSTPIPTVPPSFLSVAERFLSKHTLNPLFSAKYTLNDELGAGGFGFVCSAFRKSDMREVAVKFILKNKIPAQGWARDSVYGLVPLECYFIRKISHPNIIGFIDFFDDESFCYLVTELHGSPWNVPSDLLNTRTLPAQSSGNLIAGANSNISSSLQEPSPLMSPALSLPKSNPRPTPPYEHSLLKNLRMMDCESPPASPPIPATPPILSPLSDSTNLSNSTSHRLTSISSSSSTATIASNSSSSHPALAAAQSVGNPAVSKLRRFKRRNSCDLFECIEQHERFTEAQARHIFRQIASAVHFLHINGVVHRDIKDENILVDQDYRVKIIDFGSASFIPNEVDKLFDRFLGTIQYAAPEIFRGEKYRGPEAEVWALGCCLYVMLTGCPPFDSPPQAVNSPFNQVKVPLSKECMHLLKWSLAKDPKRRPSIQQIMQHPWLSCPLLQHQVFSHSHLRH